MIKRALKIVFEPKHDRLRTRINTTSKVHADVYNSLQTAASSHLLASLDRTPEEEVGFADSLLLSERSGVRSPASSGFSHSQFPVAQY